MKCPACGSEINDNTRIIFRVTRAFYQDTLDDTTIRIGDLQVDSKRFVTEPITETRTLFDSAWVCSHCGERIETKVPDGQNLLHDYKTESRTR